MGDATDQEQKSSIPSIFHDAAKKLAKDAIKGFIKEGELLRGDTQVIGLGSGPMATAIVRQMKHDVRNKERIECIVTSFQIKLEAEYCGLKVIDGSHISEIDVVFDGADEIDSKFNMIKGGGGPLLKEKIAHSVGKKLVITAESKKFVQTFSWPVPIEVSPFGVFVVARILEEKAEGKPKLRMLNQGYPYVREW